MRHFLLSIPLVDSLSPDLYGHTVLDSSCQPVTQDFKEETSPTAVTTPDSIDLLTKFQNYIIDKQDNLKKRSEIYGIEGSTGKIIQDESEDELNNVGEDIKFIVSQRRKSELEDLTLEEDELSSNNKQNEASLEDIHQIEDVPEVTGATKMLQQYRHKIRKKEDHIMNDNIKSINLQSMSASQQFKIAKAILTTARLIKDRSHHHNNNKG